MTESERPSRRAWLQRGGERGSGGERAKQHRPERENSAGQRQRGSRAERDCLFERLWQPEGWVRWQKAAPRAPGEQRAVPLSGPPASPPAVSLAAPAAAFRDPREWLKLRGEGSGGGRCSSSGTSPQQFQGSVQLWHGIHAGPTESSAITPHPQVACPQLEVDAEVGGGVRPQKSAHWSCALKAPNTKGGKLREILFLPASPQLCRRAPFQLWSCVLSLV